MEPKVKCPYNLWADTFERSSQEVGVIKITLGKSSYEYIDKAWWKPNIITSWLSRRRTNPLAPKPTRPFFSSGNLKTGLGNLVSSSSFVGETGAPSFGKKWECTAMAKK
jgi:hypothetical protein